MIEFRTLGGLSLGTAGPPDNALTRPRALALLSVLAVAAPAAVGRERVLALLWPESDDDRARNALNQTLFVIRREIGVADAVLGRSDLRLNPAAVSADVVRFEEAMAAGNLPAAVAAYAGPFLAGFHLSDCPEFERWVDQVRDRLTRRIVLALQSLADVCTELLQRHRGRDSAISDEVLLAAPSFEFKP